MFCQRPHLLTFSRYLHIILSHCTPYHARICHAPRTMPYVYATALPGHIVKLGRTEHHKERALAAQTYYAESVSVLAMWRVLHGTHAEGAAHKACAHWHVHGELYRVPTDWLDLEHPLVVRVSDVLGDPMLRAELPTPRLHNRRTPWWKRFIKT